MNPSVNWFFDKETKWQEAYQDLRTILLDVGLTEELKWGCPCYTFQGSNVVLIHGFKDYCALLFMKGVLLKDPKNLLVQQTKNVQSARQIRFTHADQIDKLRATLKSYIKEAIRVEKLGIKVEMKETKQFDMPEEFRRALEEMPSLSKAFRKLTPGRQRGYLLYFASAKQSKTRESRIEKHLDKILAGKGLDD